MPIHVKLPDGSIGEFPDGMPDAQIERVLQKQFGGPSVPATASPILPELGGGDRVSEKSMSELITGGHQELGGYDPTRDMNWAEKGLAGYGSGVHQLWTGAKQLGAFALDQVPGLELGAYRDGLRKEVARDRELDAPLLDTGWGAAGNFLGQVVTSAPVGGVLGVGAKGATLGQAALRGAAAGAIEGSVQPVADEGERIRNMELGGAFGGGLPVVGRGIMRAGEEMLPSNITSRALNFFGEKANKTPFADEGEALAQRTGINLTPGMISGSKTQTGAENIARQSLFSADKAFEADEKVATQAVGYVNRVMDRISRDNLSPQGIGEGIQGAVRDGLNKIRTSREEVAKQQYGALRKVAGDLPVVDYGATKKVLNDIIGEYDGVPGADANRLRKQAQKLLDDIATKSGYTLDQARKARSFYGNAAAGSANVFKDVAPGLNARIAKRLWAAMSEDLDAAGTKLDEAVGFNGSAMVPGGATAMKPSEMLKKANDDYRRHSKLLEAVELSPLKRLLGDQISVDDFMTVNSLAPEKVIERVNAMKPSEIAMVRDFMERSAPDTWQQYKRLIVDDALATAATAPGSAGAKVLPFSANAFIRAIGGDKPDKIARLQAVFSPDEMAELGDALSAARRMGDKFGANFSGTGPYNEVMAAIRNASVKGAASTASAAMGLDKVARMMLNSDGRKAVIELSKLPPNSKRANDLAAYVATLGAVKTEAQKPLEVDIVGGNPSAGDQAQAEQERRQREDWLREQKAAGKL